MGRINELFRRLLPLRKADAQPPLKRAFSGAQFSRLTDWVLAGVKINQELRSQYNLGYISSNPRRDGSYRKIEIKVPEGNLKLNYRKGYYAPSN